MYVEPKDSRQRYTKQCLFSSFERALQDKPVSDITVSEICNDAGISRKTFYKYYSDPFALLLAMQDDLFAGLGERLAELPPDVYAISSAIIDFVAEHRVVTKAVFENRGEGNLIDRVLDQLYVTYHESWEQANPDMAESDVEFLFHYVTSGWVGIVRLWLFKYPSMDVDEVKARADSLMKLTTPHA
ncbi:TetR/AcrR family transcriptional regulator [Gordonibacter massiliensis (ex Traore et al. 2017)]|uniref:TetR/AcrR family transcriptional regulator n=1 Tax=Gordonibacter massiliensis (ex Traore et al. 2017) TaxID=1841863 RepID=UPI001C8B8253|nr:TetR/AcrR family transcriptional regulator [Gordonibacter massiliensis (ex Traore et al. 2017)]MBX9032448.1 TetR/AcrR family transcriptional regulator [Gordonibacter massiliensis (ex Traore et al. 2017)]